MIAELIEPYKGIIYDPCCGTGGMFVQSIKFIENQQGTKKEVEIAKNYDAEAGQFLRTDRVVVSGNMLTILDYKTGIREVGTEAKYRKQVKGYAAVYSGPGYQNIENKLVYIYEDEVEVVDI